MSAMSYSYNSFKQALLLQPRQEASISSARRATALSLLEPDYSKPVVSVSLLWNAAHVIASVVMLVFSLEEKPNEPLRIWLCGFVFLRLIRLVLIFCEYRRKRDGDSETGGASVDQKEDYSNVSTFHRCCWRVSDVNNVISIIWWIIGVYWVIKGGHKLLSDALYLYWTSVFFLAFVMMLPLLSTCLVGAVIYCCPRINPR